MITNEEWSKYVDKYGLIIFHSKLLEFQVDGILCITKIEVDLFGNDSDIQKCAKEFWVDLLEPLIEKIEVEENESRCDYSF